MVILQIEHSTASYEGWKQAFDNDPLGRKQSGVRFHRILRPVDDEKTVMVELEFDTLEAAEAMIEKLHQLWSRVDASIMMNPHARIVEIWETQEY